MLTGLQYDEVKSADDLDVITVLGAEKTFDMQSQEVTSAVDPKKASKWAADLFAIMEQGFLQPVRGSNVFPGWTQDFLYTRIQISTGATVWHCDKANVDWSVSLSCGDFIGGELEFTDYSVNTFLTPTLFDGTNWHRTAAFEGERFAIVCFTHGLYGRLRTMYYDSC